MDATGEEAGLVWLLFLVVSLMVGLAVREVIKGLCRQGRT
jgi:hypothetical protein